MAHALGHRIKEAVLLVLPIRSGLAGVDVRRYERHWTMNRFHRRLDPATRVRELLSSDSDALRLQGRTSQDGDPGATRRSGLGMHHVPITQPRVGKDLHENVVGSSNFLKTEHVGATCLQPVKVVATGGRADSIYVCRDDGEHS